MRLSKSALRLREDRCRIIDVAMELGFGSVDGYQRAFAKEFGCNPKQYAMHPLPLYLFRPFGVSSRFAERSNQVMKQTKNIFLQVMEKPARQVVIKRAVHAKDYFEYCEEVGCDIWGLLLSMKSIGEEPVSLWLPENYRTPNTSEYVQGVEKKMEDCDEIPDGFDRIILPTTTYLMFQGEPFAEEDYCDAIDEIWEVEQNYDPSVIGYQWNLDEPRIQLEPIGSRGYIELVPLKRIESN